MIGEWDIVALTEAKCLSITEEREVFGPSQLETNWIINCITSCQSHIYLSFKFMTGINIYPSTKVNGLMYQSTIIAFDEFLLKYQNRVKFFIFIWIENH